MKQKTLFSPKPKKEYLEGIEGFERVKDNEHWRNCFDILFSKHSDYLYDYSVTSPFAYFNSGQLELYVNSDWVETGDIIPVVKKFKNKPQLFLYAPFGNLERIYEVMQKCSTLSTKKCRILATTDEWSTKFIEAYPEQYKRNRDISEYVNNMKDQFELKGKKFKSLRYLVKRAKEDYPDVEIQRITKNNVHLAVELFNTWKVTQGKKYFRVTVGRDIRLVEHYCDPSDDRVVSIMLVKDGKAVGVMVNSINTLDPTQAICVTAKALPEYPNMTYLMYHKMRELMVLRGVTHENISGAYTPGTRKFKERWRPEFKVDSFSINEIVNKN